MPRGNPRPSRTSQATLLGFSALTIACAGLLSAGIGWITTNAARNSAMTGAAVVRQGDIEHDLWSVIDPDDLHAPLGPAPTAELDRILPSAFGARSSIVWADVRTVDGTSIWTWGDRGEIDEFGGVPPSASVMISGGSADAMERVTYRLPLRPLLATDVVAVFTAEVADADVAALGSGYPVRSISFVVGGVLLAWAACLVLARWMLRKSWGETETQRRVAMIDPLTGLANRSAMNERGDAAIANANRQAGHVGLVLVDLNRFKAVNDTGGHALGDRVLIEVGRRLLEVTRKGELAVRVGGDEFAVLVPVVHRRSELESLAVRVRAALEIPVRFSAADDVRVTASVGTAWSPVDGTSMGELFKTADTLMYAEKNRVRGPLNDSIARARLQVLANNDARTGGENAVDDAVRADTSDDADAREVSKPSTAERA